MHRTSTKQAFASVPTNLVLAAAALLTVTPAFAQPASGKTHPTKTHRAAKPVDAQPEIAQAPAPPPMPRWPVNDSPNPASVVWDASGLRINASNSSLQQILNEVSTDTGTKVIGSVPDQRVFGSYGPGNASDVLLQLLQGSGYNVLLAGDLGHGAPSQLVLTPRHGGPANASSPQPPQQQMQPPDEGEETGDQPEPPEQQEETVPAIPPPNQPNQNQPGFGPNGPMRTPQEIMQEMQQRQLQQQQQMQQQMQQQQQQGNPTAPQQQENPE
jgi:hypothetical protein